MTQEKWPSEAALEKHITLTAADSYSKKLGRYADLWENVRLGAYSFESFVRPAVVAETSENILKYVQERRRGMEEFGIPLGAAEREAIHLFLTQRKMARELRTRSDANFHQLLQLLESKIS